MNNTVKCILVLVLVAILIVAGCSGPAPMTDNDAAYYKTYSGQRLDNLLDSQVQFLLEYSMEQAHDAVSSFQATIRWLTEAQVYQLELMRRGK